MIRTFLFVGSIGLLTLTGCESAQDANTTMPAMPTSAPAMGMLNSTCPVSGQPVSADSTLDYKGYTIGFCCENCKTPWAAMTADDKGAYVAQQLQGK